MISILAKSRSVEGAAEADRILHWFLESYQKDVQSSTIDEEQLRLYPIGQPKVDHYITVFLGYGRRRDKRKAFHRIGELLVEMEQLHDTGLVHLKPNYQVRFFVNVIVFVAVMMYESLTFDLFTSVFRHIFRQLSEIQ